MRRPRVLFAMVTAAAVGALAAAQSPPRLVLVDDARELDAALAAKTPPRDLSVRVAGITLPDADPTKVQLLILAEIAPTEAGATKADAGAAGPSSALVSVSYIIEDERGQARAKGLRRRELQPTAGGAFDFTEAVSVPAGSYRVKVAVMRNTRIGAAQATVAATARTAGSLRLGDLVVGETVGEDIAASVAFDHRIRGDHLVASLPFAGPSAPADVAIAVEVAKNESGPAMMSAAARLSDTRDAVRIAQAVVDVRALPPGDYVARVVVSQNGTEAGRATTPFTREAVTRAAGSPTPAGGTPAGRGRTAAAPALAGGAFQAEEVLAPAVLRPFLDDLAARAPDRAKPAIEQAKAGRFVDAAKAASSGDANDPAKPFLQGLSLFSQKQLQAASESFRETLRAAPDYFVGAFYIGACYAAGGRDPQAVNAWQTSLVGLDQYPIVFRLLADALTRMGQPDRALETLDEAVAKWPEDGALRARAARAALDAKRYERALALVDEWKGQPNPELLFAGMQAIFEQVSQRADAADGATVARMKRYRDAYVAAGGPQQALVAEWSSTVERKK